MILFYMTAEADHAGQALPSNGNADGGGSSVLTSTLPGQELTPDQTVAARWRPPVTVLATMARRYLMVAVLTVVARVTAADQEAHRAATGRAVAAPLSRARAAVAADRSLMNRFRSNSRRLILKQYKIK